MMIGPKRHRITLQRRSETISAAGDVVPGWANLKAAVPASIEPIRGTERMAANQVMDKVSHKIRIRYSSDYANLNATDRIIDSSSPQRVWDIVAVLNLFERDRELEILAEEKF